MGRPEGIEAVLAAKNPQTYDCAGAVLFNAHAGTLWARFTTYLRRELAARLGMPQKAAHAVLRVSFDTGQMREPHLETPRRAREP